MSLGDTLEERLRRIEGLLAMLVRNADTDPESEIARAYRRGYQVGHRQGIAGARCDPERALTSRRRKAAR